MPNDAAVAKVVRDWIASIPQLAPDNQDEINGADMVEWATQLAEDVRKADETGERDAILAALDKWIGQRPGLEFGNYGDVRSYNAEVSRIRRDGRIARTLLLAVRNRPSITADALKYALKHNYSGRLSWNGQRLDYCTGQYWPTEYRSAACAVLAGALWERAREDNPALDGDDLRTKLRKQFGRGIADRWFT